MACTRTNFVVTHASLHPLSFCAADSLHAYRGQQCEGARMPYYQMIDYDKAANTSACHWGVVSIQS